MLPETSSRKNDRERAAIVLLFYRLKEIGLSFRTVFVNPKIIGRKVVNRIAFLVSYSHLKSCKVSLDAYNVACVLGRGGGAAKNPQTNPAKMNRTTLGCGQSSRLTVMHRSF